MHLFYSIIQLLLFYHCALLFIANVLQSVKKKERRGLHERKTRVKRSNKDERTSNVEWTGLRNGRHDGNERVTVAFVAGR